MDINKKYENKHLNKIITAQKRLTRRYYSKIDIIAQAFSISKLTKGKVYHISDDPVFNKKVNAILRELSDEITGDISEEALSAWELSNQKNIDIVNVTYKRKKLTDAQMEDILLSSNKTALEAFKNRVVGGFTLSDRIWNHTKQYKNEIEAVIIDAINNGTPATRLAQSLKKNLKEPDNLFRRVRDANGVLKPSKAMKQYKTGQGIYKSSYKNALRVARTEINTSFRTADNQLWKNTPFVKGFVVNLSNNHKNYDICDVLKGEYPTSFIWTGWHPQCLCFSTPILPSSAEYDAWEDAYIKGIDITLKQVPVNPQLNVWLQQNKQRIMNWKTTPHFIKDNKLFKK